MSFYTLQNSYKGSISLDFGTNGASLRFSPVFKPISPKDIQKGVKVYNYEASQFFTIGIDELVTVEQVIDALILNGPNAFNEMQGDYGTIKISDSGLTIIHYPKGGMSKFSIFVTSGEGQRPGLMLGYELSDQNKNSQFKLYISINISQLLVFKRYIQAQYTFMATMEALDRHHWKMKKEASGGYNGGAYNNGGNNSYGRNNVGNYGGGYNNTGNNAGNSGGNYGGGFSNGGNYGGGNNNFGGGNNGENQVGYAASAQGLMG